MTGRALRAFRVERFYSDFSLCPSPQIWSRSPRSPNLAASSAPFSGIAAIIITPIIIRPTTVGDAA